MTKTFSSPKHNGKSAGTPISPASLEALRGYSFERLEQILLQSIQDAKRESGNYTLFEHNVTLDRMDLSGLLWPDVPRGFTYMLFDAFKQPLYAGDVRGGSGSFKDPKSSAAGSHSLSAGAMRRASLPANLFSAAAATADGHEGASQGGASRASPGAAASILRGSGDGGGGGGGGGGTTARQIRAVERRLDGLEGKLDAVLEALGAAPPDGGRARTRPEPLLVPGATPPQLPPVGSA